MDPHPSEQPGILPRPLPVPTLALQLLKPPDQGGRPRLLQRRPTGTPSLPHGKDVWAAARPHPALLGAPSTDSGLPAHLFFCNKQHLLIKEKS